MNKKVIAALTDLEADLIEIQNQVEKECDKYFGINNIKSAFYDGQTFAIKDAISLIERLKEEHM